MAPTTNPSADSGKDESAGTVEQADDHQADGETDWVLLFSSDRRQIYEQDVYNATAYPPGTVIQFRYRERWVEGNATAQELESRDAIIVGCIEKDDQQRRIGKGPGKYDYYPVRGGTIIETRETGNTIQLYCMLDHRLPDYSLSRSVDSENVCTDISESEDNTAWDKIVDIQELFEDQPRRPLEGNAEDDNDVFLATAAPEFDRASLIGGDDFQRTGLLKYLKNDNMYTNWVENDDRWFSIIDALAEEERYAQTLFYRVVSVEPASKARLRERIFGVVSRPTGDRKRPPETSVLSSETDIGYNFYSGIQYKIQLEMIFADDAPDDADEGELLASGETGIDVFPSEQPLGFRVNETSLIFDPEPRSRTRHSMMTIDTDLTNVDTTEDVSAPQVEIPLRLQAEHWLSYGALFISVIGVVIIAASGFIPSVLADSGVWELSANNQRQFAAVLTIVGLGAVTYGFRLYGNND